MKCFFCDKTIDGTYYEVLSGEELCYMCGKCGADYTAAPTDGLAGVAKELLSFLVGTHQHVDGCVCGMTGASFDKRGRFGCPECYTHFKHKVDEVVLPYHKADQHAGKRPKCQLRDKLDADPEEKIKVLKLNLARAVELENFELADALKAEIEAVKAKQKPK